MNLSRLFIHRPVATTLLTRGDRPGWSRCLQRVAGVSAAPGRFPHHLRRRRPARSQRRNHGSFRCHSSGAAIRPHRRRHGNDLDQFAWQHGHHAPVRPQPQHRWRSARRGGRHQRGAHLPARQPAREPHLPQSESGRLAHHGHRPHLGHLRPRQALRRGFHHRPAEALANSGSRPGHHRRRRAAFGPRRCESHAAQPLRAHARQRSVDVERAKCAPGPRPAL